jgi:S-formylglutathione hydrolase
LDGRKEKYALGKSGHVAMNKIMYKSIKQLLFAFLLGLILIPTKLVAQSPKGITQRIKIHSKLLEGNLSGDSPDRYMSVYLPAGYSNAPKKRYPVVYFLHGYTDDDAKVYGFKKHWMVLPSVLDTVFAQDPAHEMIFVTPDAYTRFQGSMYSNSATTGNWEDFIAKEVVEYMDTHYRTISKKEGRGLSGHSMGGYGALRIGEKNPDVFSAVYLLSPCCLNSSPMDINAVPSSYMRADSIKTIGAFEQSDFLTKALFASAAAWSPNPNNPPFYVDLPVKDGQFQPHVLRKWDANRPLNNLDQYITHIKKLKAIGFDAGNKDTGIAESIKTLDIELNKYKIPHTFEIYEGDHINRVAKRIEGPMFKFFTTHLKFE